MEEEGVSNHYDDTDKLKVYQDIIENCALVKNGYAYHIKRLMPDVMGKTVLDLPCGIGLYVRILHDLGAAKVIASDIVPRQLEVSREKDKEHGIQDGFVQYYQHDAKIPKQLCSELADVCLSIHFFCFAETIDELRRMTRTILANLKPAGCCLIYVCSLGSASEDEQMFQKDLEKFEENLVFLDPPSSDKFKPRRYHTMIKGFHFNRYVKCMHTLI